MRLCCLPHLIEDVRARVAPLLTRARSRLRVWWGWFTGTTQRRWRLLRAQVQDGALAL